MTPLEEQLRTELTRRVADAPTGEEVAAAVRQRIAEQPVRGGIRRHPRSAILLTAAAVTGVIAGSLMLEGTPLGGGSVEPAFRPALGASAYVYQRPDQGRGGSEDVFYTDAQTGTHPVATTDVDEYSPNLSLATGRIVFVRALGGEDAELFTVPAGSTQAEQVTSGPGRAGGPQWSPDGRSICYWRDGGSGRPQLFVLNVQTGAERQISTGDDIAVHPTWATDGQSIAYVSSGGAGQRLVEVNLNTLAMREIDPAHAAYSFPAVSPNGQNIAAVLSTPAGERVVALDRGSGNRIWAGEPLGLVLDLVWTRTGVLVTAGHTKSTTYVLEPATGDVTRSIPVQGLPSWPS